MSCYPQTLTKFMQKPGQLSGMCLKWEDKFILKTRNSAYDNSLDLECSTVFCISFHTDKLDVACVALIFPTESKTKGEKVKYAAFESVEALDLLRRESDEELASCSSKEEAEELARKKYEARKKLKDARTAVSSALGLKNASNS